MLVLVMISVLGCVLEGVVMVGLVSWLWWVRCSCCVVVDVCYVFCSVCVGVFFWCL